MFLFGKSVELKAIGHEISQIKFKFISPLARAKYEITSGEYAKRQSASLIGLSFKTHKPGTTLKGRYLPRFELVETKTSLQITSMIGIIIILLCRFVFS